MANIFQLEKIIKGFLIIFKRQVIKHMHMPSVWPACLLASPVALSLWLVSIVGRKNLCVTLSARQED